MLERYSRALPSRQLGQRFSASRPSTVAGHRSFRLTQAGKQGLMKKGFSNYVPEKFQRTLRQLKAKGTSGVRDQDIAYFVRQVKNDRTLESKEEIQKFARGFLKEAHQEKVQMREGYNPARHEYEQAQRLTSEMMKQAEAATPKVPMRDYEAEHREALARVRHRLGVQHGRSNSTTPQPTIITPTPLGSTPEPTSSPQTAPSPSFNPSSRGFIGGRITTQRDVTDTPIRPPSVEPPPIQPVEPLPSEPSRPADQTPKPEVKIPDPSQAEELPI